MSFVDKSLQGCVAEAPRGAEAVRSQMFLKPPVTNSEQTTETRHATTEAYSGLVSYALGGLARRGKAERVFGNRNKAQGEEICASRRQAIPALV
jgi:hypothetical protein